MNTFTGLLLIVCALFTVYKIYIKIKRIRYISNMQKNIKKNINLIDVHIDERIHSSPSYDFPNVQPETDMKIVNSGPDLCSKQSELNVKHYCKY